MRGVHVALLWQIILMCNVPVLRFFMALVWYLFYLYGKKYTLNARVPIEYQAIKLRTHYLPAALLSIARRRYDVCMANRSCYESAAIFFENWFKRIAAPLRTRRLCVGSFNGPDQ